MLLTPLLQTVTPSRTPSPLERDVLYGRPPSRMSGSASGPTYRASYGIDLEDSITAS